MASVCFRETLSAAPIGTVIGRLLSAELVEARRRGNATPTPSSQRGTSILKIQLTLGYPCYPFEVPSYAIKRELPPS